MKNNSSQSRFAKATAKVIILVLAVFLSISVLPTFSADMLPEAVAAEESYVVPADTKASVINSQLASYSAGTVVNMKLMGDVDLTASGDTHSSGITGIVIPSGITVNLFMNGKSIYFRRDSSGAWQLPYVYAIHNKGTLNVYSGATATASNTAANITLTNIRTGMSTDTKRELSYCNLEGIRNEGNLTVNSKVTITVNTTLSYDKINTGGSLTNESASQVASGATAIYNTSAANCKANDVTFNVSALSQGTYTSQCDDGERTDSVAVAYGIYGGTVTVSGDTKINVTSNGNHSRDTYMAGAENGRSVLTSVAYGIAPTGSVTVTGGTITHDANIANDAACKSDGDGKQFLYSGGIFVKTGNVPVLPDVTITTPDENCMNSDEGTVTYRKGTVAVSGTMIDSASAIVSYMMEYHERATLVPTSVSAGSFYDEARNSYSTNMSTSINGIPTGITHGALNGTNRVHIVYRYWKDANRSGIDTSIVGENGNVGYSYMPLADGTNVVNSLVTLSGVAGQNNLTKSPDAVIRYLTGAESCNSYYWGFIGVSYATTPSWLSDYAVTSTANKGTVIKNFNAQSATDKEAPATDGPIYIFVDYGRISATSVKVNVGTAGVATTTYTGYPIKASDIGLKVRDSVYDTDYSGEYDLDFTGADLINVSYSYTGTNAAGITEVSSSGNLPANAGTYEVTLHIAESITYDKDPKHNKNRYGIDHTFTLVIEQASILRGDLPERVGDDGKFIYGQKLSDSVILNLGSYSAKGLANDNNVQGTFSFANPADGTSFKDAGKGTVSITWTPTYGASANTKNYKATTFSVAYTIAKAPLTIKPNAAIVTYGEAVENFDVPYAVTIDGLVANDSTDSVRETISKALNYMLEIGDGYSGYVPGEVGAGSYYIRATFTDVPSVLRNYDYEYVYGATNNPEGVLKVNKRAVTVMATTLGFPGENGEIEDPIKREYAPDDFSAVVRFKVTDGKFGQDDIRFAATTGGLDNNNAGRRTVNGITKQVVSELITGGSANNYYLSELVYDTGNVLYVDIVKAVPVATTPVVTEMFYQRARTLKDVSLEGSTTSVPGTWQWVDESINPTVNVQTYKAKFVPVSTDNYEIKEADVTVKVKTTPVIISYTGTVAYGDNIPNITSYIYTSDLDPSFDIEAVTTSGNITPRTSYVKGSPVVDGGYKVEISAPNFVDVNGNYSFSTVDGVINVKPRNIEFRVTDTAVTYGENFVPSATTVKVTYNEADLVGTDTIESITASGTEPTFEYSTDFRYIDNYKVGSYYLKATPNFATSPNYTVSSVSGTLRVTKAQLVIKADDITLEYGSAIPADISSAFDVVGAKRNEGVGDVISSGSIKVDTTYQKGSPVNADGYPITIDVTGAVFNNYSVTVQHGTITVIKATPKITSLPTAAIVHGDTLGDAVFTGGAVENGVAGKYLYDSATTSPAYRTEAYTIYTATFIPADTVNYNTVKGLYISLTVGKKPVAGALAVTGVPMVGETLTVDVTGLNPDELGVYSIIWYNGAGTQIGTGKEIKLTETHKLQALTVKAVANAPYTGEVTYVTTTIAPSLTSIETILTEEDFKTYFVLSGLENLGSDASYVYNAQPHNVVFNRNDSSLSSAAIGEVTVKYNGSVTAPTAVGYYTVTIDVATPEGIAGMTITTNSAGDTVDAVTGKTVYSPIANHKIGTLIITPASYYVVVEVDDKVYDGTGSTTAKVLSETGACEVNGGYDDVAFDASAAVYYFTEPSVGVDKDVFVNNAMLKGESAANYDLTIDLANGGKADITKRTLKIKVVPVEREYEANNYYVDLSFETVGNTIAQGDEGLVYVNESLVQGSVDNYRAGLRNVTVAGAVLTGSKAGNYTLELTNLDGLTVQILKATPGYPIPMTDVLYYDSARTLKSISLGDSRWTWDSEVINDVPGAGVHTYKAIYTPDDTANYATVEYDFELEILKTTVTITAANFTVTYGDIEPTYYYNVTGLTGADTIKNSVDGYVLMNCSYAAGSDVGLYDVVLTGAFESDNYSFIYNNGTVNVKPRAAYVEAIAESREYEAGNTKVNVNFSALTNIYGTDAKNVYLEGEFPIIGTIENDTAGEKTVTYTMPGLAGSKAKNYELRLLNPTLTVEIKKAVIKGVILPTTGVVDYGQKLSTTIFTSGYAGTEYGTFTMENPTSTPSSVGTTSNVYKVVFTPYNTLNYATVSQYITLTVNPAALNLAISITGTTQVGKTLYVLTNDIPANASQYLIFEWYRVDSVDSDYRTGYKVATGKDMYTLTEGDGGKYIICRAINADNSPYECEAFCITDSSIEEEALTFWQRLVNWFYRIISNITQIFGKLV